MLQFAANRPTPGQTQLLYVCVSVSVSSLKSESFVVFVTDKLEKKVRELYDTVCRLEEEKYDWEFKLRKMDFEVRTACIFFDCKFPVYKGSFTQCLEPYCTAHIRTIFELM